MRTTEIIEKLCSHELTKAEAEELIEAKLDALRRKGDYEFRVLETGFTVQNDDYILKLMLPGGHRLLQYSLKPGDKVDLTLLT